MSLRNSRQRRAPHRANRQTSFEVIDNALGKGTGFAGGNEQAPARIGEHSQRVFDAGVDFIFEDTDVGKPLAI
jgi:hypothetical protein